MANDYGKRDSHSCKVKFSPQHLLPIDSPHFFDETALKKAPEGNNRLPTALILNHQTFLSLSPLESNPSSAQGV